MRAVTFDQHGGPEVLTLVEKDTPEPGPGQLLVETAATGVNFIETYQRGGVYKVALPFALGGEGSGRVVAVGDGVTLFSVGDRIATAEGTGTYAESFLVDEQKAVAVPDGVDDQTAAALPLQGYTAHYLSHSVFPAGPDHTVLLHAGAGGVGLLLTQLLKAKGTTVITTVGTDEKAELSKGAGADHVLRYDGFSAAVRELTDGNGVDAVFDGVGKTTFDESLASLAVRGMMVLFGGASGPVPAIDPMRLAAGGSLLLTRPTMASFLRSYEERQWRATDLFTAVAEGRLDVRIGGVHKLEDAAAAQQDLEARRTTGKLILVP